MVQFGELYVNVAAGSIDKPVNNLSERLFRDPADGLWKTKDINGVLTLFSDGINIPISIFQQVVSTNNVDGGEDTLATHTIAGGTLATNGESIQAKYAIRFANTANAKVIKLYFGGTEIFASTHDYSGGGVFNLDVNVYIIRVDADTIKTVVSYVTGAGATSVTESTITVVEPVDLTIDNILLVTGTGVATNDITLLFGKGQFIPAT